RWRDDAGVRTPLPQRALGERHRARRLPRRPLRAEGGAVHAFASEQRAGPEIPGLARARNAGDGERWRGRIVVRVGAVLTPRSPRTWVPENSPSPRARILPFARLPTRLVDLRANSYVCRSRRFTESCVALRFTTPAPESRRCLHVAPPPRFLSSSR